MSKRVLLAEDGLLARDQGRWAESKLRWFESYLTPALGATRKFRGNTHYLDLFAGTGRNVSIDAKSGRRVEFDGSPILALKASQHGKDPAEVRFGHFHFFNISKREDKALRIRVRRTLEDLGGVIHPDRVQFHPGDSNAILPSVLSDIGASTYLFAFLDIEGPTDLAFDTVRALRARHGHVDLYLLFPTKMGIDRMLAYDPEHKERFHTELDRFFGTPEWRNLAARRFTPAQGKELRTGLLQLYLGQLETLWKYAGRVMEVVGTGSMKYDMLFATDNEIAATLAEWARKKALPPSLFDNLGS